MQHVTATEAKNHLATVMQKAVKEPIVIEKNGQPYVVMMSVEEYEKTATETRRENFVTLCHQLASTAKKNGMTEEILASILAEKD